MAGPQTNTLTEGILCLSNRVITAPEIGINLSWRDTYTCSMALQTTFQGVQFRAAKLVVQRVKPVIYVPTVLTS